MKVKYITLEPISLSTENIETFRNLVQFCTFQRHSLVSSELRPFKLSFLIWKAESIRELAKRLVGQ